jgi:hypothetical protein
MEKCAMIQYTCPAETLPLIEAGFTAHGYHAPLLSYRSVSHCPVVVLIADDGAALLVEHQSGDPALVEIYGENQAIVSAWLESLPLALQRQQVSSVPSGIFYSHTTCPRTDREDI